MPHVGFSHGASTKGDIKTGVLKVSFPPHIYCATLTTPAMFSTKSLRILMQVPIVFPSGQTMHWVPKRREVRASFHTVDSHRGGFCPRWCAARVIACLPKAIKRITALERTKEEGAQANPQYLGVACSTKAAKLPSLSSMAAHGRTGSKVLQVSIFKLSPTSPFTCSFKPIRSELFAKGFNIAGQCAVQRKPLPAPSRHTLYAHPNKSSMIPRWGTISVA